MSMLKGKPVVHNLPVFLSGDGLPQTMEETVDALNSELITEVRSHVLGPAGTNIMKAAEQWHKLIGITDKAKIVECETPELGLELSRAAPQDSTLHVFWTCAVYFREYEIFFENPDALPFLFQITIPLDDMQLACRPESINRMRDADFKSWNVLSHPSPAPLLKSLPVKVWVARSNADAAVRCSKGEAEACITTETARELNGLVELHRFGSPPMVFFGGVSSRGADLLRRSLKNKNLVGKGV